MIQKGAVVAALNKMRFDTRAAGLRGFGGAAGCEVLSDV